MKYNLLKLLLVFFLFGCEKENILTDLESSNEIESVMSVPQTIYPTSIQNHEWNNFVYSTKDEFIHNGGTSPVYFNCGFAYFDYDSDGDWDVFLSAEQIINTTTLEHIPSSGKTLGVLINKGTQNGITQWEWNSDIVPQTNRGYRKISTADMDNDGDLDMVGFTAHDADSNSPIMGGIDIFVNEGGYFTTKVVHPYSEGMSNFMHGGSLGDVTGDGLVDIISGTQTIKLWINLGNNTFSDFIEPTRYQTTNGHSNIPTGSFSTEVFDINGDGYNDLLVGSAKGLQDWRYYDYYTDSDYAKHSEIFFGKPEYPYFNQEPDIELEPDYQFVGEDNWVSKTWTGNMDWSVADLDNDGDYDFFIYLMKDCTSPTDDCNSYYISYYENINNQSYIPKTEEVFHTNEQFFNNTPLTYIKSWDVDNDGKVEIMLEANESNFNIWKLSGGKLTKWN